VPPAFRRPGAPPAILPVEANWLGRDTVPHGAAWAGDAVLGPRLHQQETEEGLRFTLELPGYELKDIKLRARGGAIHLQAFRRRRVGQGESMELLRRVLPLPPGLDAGAAQAQLRLGLLTVDVPRAGAPAGDQAGEALAVEVAAAEPVQEAAREQVQEAAPMAAPEAAPAAALEAAPVAAPEPGQQEAALTEPPLPSARPGLWARLARLLRGQ
jgi:HSP20 family molecular chaperone IbpA